jgi:hypothetical protein
VAIKGVDGGGVTTVFPGRWGVDADIRNVFV